MESEVSLLHSQAPYTCLSILSQRNPAHVSPPHFLKIHFNIIFQSVPRSSKCCLIILDLITQIIFGEEYRAQSTLLCSLFYSPITSSLLGLNIFLSTFSLPSSLTVSNQDLHPYKTTGKITVLYILSFYYRIANWKTKDPTTNDRKHSLTSTCS